MKKMFMNVVAVLVLAGISAACFIPVWVFLLVYHFANPSGFWQKFALFGVGIWFLAGLQFIGLILFIAFWIAILSGGK